MDAMTLTAASNPLPRFGRLFGGALLGTALVTIGLVADYLTIATPLVSTLVPAYANRGSVGIALGVWSFTLIAGGALLLAGTSRLAPGPPKGGSRWTIRWRRPHATPIGSAAG
jgi:hypothetical protein